LNQNGTGPEVHAEILSGRAIKYMDNEFNESVGSINMEKLEKDKIISFYGSYQKHKNEVD